MLLYLVVSMLWCIFLLVITKSATCKYMVEVKASLCKLWIFFLDGFTLLGRFIVDSLHFQVTLMVVGLCLKNNSLFWHMSYIKKKPILAHVLKISVEHHYGHILLLLESWSIWTIFIIVYHEDEWMNWK